MIHNKFLFLKKTLLKSNINKNFFWKSLKLSQNCSNISNRSYSVILEQEALSKSQENIEEKDSTQNEIDSKKVSIDIENKTLKGEISNLSFQAETKKLLDIVARSLYSDRQVFVREIISNASDALEKLRYFQISNEIQVESSSPLKINIFVDEKKKTFIIQDNGIGMDKEELIRNLGTIAHSGSKSFLENVQTSENKKNSIIGQFGVGFYSTFMVGNSVTVYSKSSKVNSVGYCWKSTGDGQYSICEADNVELGTTIVIDLKDECLEFTNENKIKDLIKTSSNFSNFPILVNGTEINNIRAIWMIPSEDITEEQHSEFYKFISGMWDNPKFHFLYRTDIPIDIKALFYFPSTHTEKFGMGRMEPGVSIYCKKILILKKSEQLLPQWLRFVKGVVDSDDLPLNLSRELLQDNRLLEKIKQILITRIIKFLQNKLKKTPEEYDNWYKDFGNFIREGICTDEKNKTSIATLFRCETSTKPEGEKTSLSDYVNAMPSEQKIIYYVHAANRKMAESSPYVEAFKDNEILYVYEPLDEVAMTYLTEFEGKQIKSVESSKESSDKNLEQYNEQCKWFQEVLGDKVKTVKASQRLSSSPALIVDHESSVMRKMLREMDINRIQTEKYNLELNFENSLISKVIKLKETNSELANQLVHCIYDNAKLAAGVVDDPRTIVPSIYKLMESILEKKI